MQERFLFPVPLHAKLDGTRPSMEAINEVNHLLELPNLQLELGTLFGYIPVFKSIGPKPEPPYDLENLR